MFCVVVERGERESTGSRLAEIERVRKGLAVCVEAEERDKHCPSCRIREEP